jgi:diguanylate cyclase (GGDEF)-like protein
MIEIDARFASASPKDDDALHALLIQSLYGTPSAIILGMMIINAIVLSAYFLSGDTAILWMACAIGIINIYRAVAHWAYYARFRSVVDRAVQRRFEFLAFSGAWLTALTIGCFGGYTAYHYAFQATSILGVAQTMGYLAGISGRNTSRPYITQVQMVLVSVPFMMGLATTGSLAYQLIGIAVAFTLLATLSSVQSIYEVFLSRVQTMRKLEFLATHDSLTGLSNRYSLANAIHEWQKAGRPFFIVSIDLDNFKDVNDLFGHQMGDALLKEAAQRISHHFTPASVVARIGGDEFLILMHGADVSQALVVTTDIVNDLSLPFVIDNIRLRAGASAGVAAGAGVSVETALRNVDLALYQAKSSGKNQVCLYTQDIGSTYDERICLERDLRRAVELGELSLAYQPIVNPQTRRVFLVEALLRWKHPERGNISPITFIPIAEASGLISLIGTWVLQTACETAMTWPKDIGVSVNLSAKQFRRDHDLVSIVRACLRISGLEPQRLTLEITESTLIDDHAHVIEVLEKIRTLGVKIALDDFGTGYSSLSYLSKLPLDKIKIDRSFANAITTSQRSANLMRGIVGIARALSLDVIVEGIETGEQLDELEAYGIDGIQGYIFARPVDPISLLPYLAYKVKIDNEPAEINHAHNQRKAVGK